MPVKTFHASVQLKSAGLWIRMALIICALASVHEKFTVLIQIKLLRFYVTEPNQINDLIQYMKRSTFEGHHSCNSYGSNLSFSQSLRGEKSMSIKLQKNLILGYSSRWHLLISALHYGPKRFSTAQFQYIKIQSFTEASPLGTGENLYKSLFYFPEPRSCVKLNNCSTLIDFYWFLLHQKLTFLSFFPLEERISLAAISELTGVPEILFNSKMQY